MKIILQLALFFAVAGRVTAAETYAARVARVMNTPGCVAFWDCVVPTSRSTSDQH